MRAATRSRNRRNTVYAVAPSKDRPQIGRGRRGWWFGCARGRNFVIYAGTKIFATTCPATVWIRLGAKIGVFRARPGALRQSYHPVAKQTGQLWSFDTAGRPRFGVQTALGIQFRPHSAAEGRGVLSDGHKQ